MKVSDQSITGRTIIDLLRYTLLILGVGLFAIGVLKGIENIMLWGILDLLISNVFFGFAEGKTRYIFLFFHLALFTFLLARPTILFFRGSDNWWMWYSVDATDMALTMIFLSLFALRIGAVIGDGIYKRLDAHYVPKPETEYRTAFMENLARISLIIFAVTLLASYAGGIEKLMFMEGRDYNEYFLNYQSTLPYAVTALGSMAKYAMCIFLATLPKKRTAVIVLALYLIDALPLFIIGVRNPVILRLIFSVIYFILRDVLHDREKWIGRVEKTAMIIGAPVLIAFMGIYATIRMDKTVNSTFLDSIADFFYDQGTSFDTIRAVHAVMKDLPAAGPKNYTFGSFTDYLVYGSIGQKLFGMPDIGNANSVMKATYGSNLSHSAMYAINKKMYLKGWGRGSSYMLENYVDWGYIGVILGSIVLGVLLILLVYLMKQDNTLIRTIALISLLGLFFSPRAEATDWIAFLVYTQFWVLIIGVYLIAGACTKAYSYKGMERKNELTKGRQYV